jgi:hypothetical protein
MNPLTAVVIVLAAILLYFLPGLIASNRRHHNALAIGVFNLFLGWTVLGWVLALVWSLMAVNEKVTSNRF